MGDRCGLEEVVRDITVFMFTPILIVAFMEEEIKKMKCSPPCKNRGLLDTSTEHKRSHFKKICDGACFGSIRFRKWSHIIFFFFYAVIRPVCYQTDQAPRRLFSWSASWWAVLKGWLTASLVTFNKCHLVKMKRWCHFSTRLCRTLIYADSITKRLDRPFAPWLGSWLEWSHWFPLMRLICTEKQYAWIAPTLLIYSWPMLWLHPRWIETPRLRCVAQPKLADTLACASGAILPDL